MVKYKTQPLKRHNGRSDSLIIPTTKVKICRNNLSTNQSIIKPKHYLETQKTWTNGKTSKPYSWIGKTVF